MPLVRYFLFAGGILLGLMWLTDWCFPTAVSEASASDVDRSVIRIHSSHRWPSAVPIDTSAPMPPSGMAPEAVTARAATPLPASPSAHDAYTYAPAAPVPPTAHRLPEQTARHARPSPRLATREPTRHRLAYQPGWFAMDW